MFTLRLFICIKIPSHTIEIGENAFYYCKKHNRVKFSENYEPKIICSTCVLNIILKVKYL